MARPKGVPTIQISVSIRADVWEKAKPWLTNPGAKRREFGIVGQLLEQALLAWVERAQDAMDTLGEQK